MGPALEVNKNEMNERLADLLSTAVEERRLLKR